MGKTDSPVPLGSRPTQVLSDEEGVPNTTLGRDGTTMQNDSPEWHLPPRYRMTQLLGAGGMGAVLLCEDDRVGRNVALKVIQPNLAGDPEAEARFLREAKIQGQLEHQAIVPVYDLGDDADPGATYFTMKRVHGVTLAQIIRERMEHPELSAQRYSERRLLTAFSQICLALDLAHQRGVVHRDLKPANIMLGNYGEVYLLDWGLAKVRAEERRESPSEGPVEVKDMLDSMASGSLLGTPAYMSPERLRDRPEADEPPAEVYALGAILFEMLVLEQFNPGNSLKEVISAAIIGVEARPSVRAPGRGVSAELEAICVKATARRPEDRYPTARALHEAVEAYLDGERNETLRRELAERHAEAAARAVTRATRGAGLPIDDRRGAMHEIGRALALDPNNAQALDAMVTLLTEPPDELPDEVTEELRRSDEAQFRWAGRISGVAYLSILIYLPLFFWSGIRHAGALSLFYALSVISGLLALWVGFSRRPQPGSVLAVMVVSTLCHVSTTTLFGPLFLMPALVATNITGYATLLTGGYRIAAIAFGSVAILGALGLELLGIPWSSYAFTEAGMLIRPGAIDLRAAPTIVFLVITALATLLTPSLAVSRVRDNLARTERQLHLYAWQIRQLVPSFRSDATVD